jgi:hypothetical protein
MLGVHAGNRTQAMIPAITGKSKRKNGAFPIKPFIVYAPQNKNNNRSGRE